MLECLRQFLEQSRCADVPFQKIRSDAGVHKLSIFRLPVCKQVLRNMLDAGLLRKAKQATLAVTLTKKNAANVSAVLTGLTGNQQFARQLDNAGHARARKIQVLQKHAVRLARRGQQHEAESQAVRD